jgi:fibro-slime domain-containing protein
MRNALVSATILAITSFAQAAEPVVINAVIRDFQANGVEFESLNWNTRTPAAFFAFDQNNKLEKGIAGPIRSPLDATGVPVYSPSREPGFYNTMPRQTVFDALWDDTDQSIRLDVPLTFSPIGGQTHRYASANFFPINGRGFGSQHAGHNYHFSMHLRFSFFYAPGQSIYVESDDDLWLYVDRRLALDMGGIHGTYAGHLDLDTLNLIPGQTYALDLFHTERNTFGSAFVLETNLLSATPEPTFIACPLIALLLIHRRPPVPRR